MSGAIAVSLGAALGALVRWGTALAFNTAGAALPLGTLIVNTVGGLLVGVALVWFGRHPDETLRLFAVTGFLGGLTTFSAFSAESLLLIQRGDWLAALGHTLAHVLLALGAAAAGFALAQRISA